MRLFITALACFITINAVAQKATCIKVNLTDALVNRYSIGIEHNLNSKTSLAVELNYLHKKIDLESPHPRYPYLSQIQKRGIILEPQFRYYISDNLQKGLYTSIAGFFGYGCYDHDWNSLNNNQKYWSALGGSLYAGYQLKIGKVLLDNYFGFTIAENNYPLPYQESTAILPPPNGIRLSAGIRLGYKL